MVKVLCQEVGCVLKLSCKHEKCRTHCQECPDWDLINKHRREWGIEPLGFPGDDYGDNHSYDGFMGGNKV